MPTSSDSDLRRLAHRVLVLQAATGLIVALVCLAVWGRNGFVSALAGAVTGVIANLYMTFRALQPARTPNAALGRLYFGQLVKVIVTVGLFVLAYVILPQVAWPALLLAYLATLVVSWSAPLRLIRRGTGRG
ncbi:MAG TPA: ATP synthase subunit I [Steroidobacteraceae bacterium]|nr:ATP synthase subunit I [Steroidobacteraceae bacterium]